MQLSTVEARPEEDDTGVDCIVRDLDTGAVYHAERDGKLLVKAVKDPSKLLDRWVFLH
jgi:hypothetical protein